MAAESRHGDLCESGFMSVDGRRSMDSAHVFKAHDPADNHENVIMDEFNSLEEVREAIRKQGLETCNLIFGMYI